MHTCWTLNAHSFKSSLIRPDFLASSCLQLFAFISLVLDVCWRQGVGLVYLRAIELMNCFDALLQVLPSAASSFHVVEMTQRTMKSGKFTSDNCCAMLAPPTTLLDFLTHSLTFCNTGKRMVHTVFLALSNVLPITCMLVVFVVLCALLGHSFFGTTKTDFLRNRCVVEMLPRHGSHVPFMEIQEGQVASGRSSFWVHADDGRLVETVPWAQVVLKNSTASSKPLHAVVRATFHIFFAILGAVCIFFWHAEPFYIYCASS